MIELLSPTDSLRKTKQKMEDWIANGVALGWLIDPSKKRVFVYGPGVEAATVTGNAVAGSGPVKGFTPDLSEVWRSFQ